MARAGREGIAVALTALLALSPAGCGKKAPPRLPEQVPTARLESFRVRVREGQVHLDFRVPPRKTYLEGEKPWVLVHILRKASSDSEQMFAELAAMREEQGFTFGKTLSYVDADVRVGESYTYLVELFKKNSRERSKSVLLTVRLAPVPGRPEGLHAAGKEGAISLTWAPPPQAPEGILYQVYRREMGKESSMLVSREPQAVTAFIDSGLVREEEYCYQVRGLLRDQSGDNEGPPTPEICARTEDRTPPRPPTALQLVPSKGGFSLSWLPSTGEDVLGYFIYRSIGDGSFRRVNTEPLRSTSYFDTAVISGKMYRYKVTAVDKSSNRNESPFSNFVRGTIF